MTIRLPPSGLAENIILDFMSKSFLTYIRIMFQKQKNMSVIHLTDYFTPDSPNKPNHINLQMDAMSELNIKEEFKRFLLVNYGVGREREFWKMIEAPHSPLYKACLQELGPENLEKYNNGQLNNSEEFYLEMRNAFDRLTERVPEDENNLDDDDDDDGDDDDGDDDVAGVDFDT
jgi:hypothetical protein